MSVSIPNALNNPRSAQCSHPSQGQADRQRESLSTKAVLLLVASSALIALVAISGRTLWIDEALTAVKAQLPTPGAWWAQMVQERASDLQMPLYMGYIWVWEKAFGSSEWVLRMANLPWFVVGVTVLGWGQRITTPRQMFVIATVLLSPFAWYYLDEARPYAMQLGASMITLGVLCRISPRDSEVSKCAISLFFAGLILLSGSSMLGMIWAGAAILAFAIILGRSRLSVLGSHRFLTLGSGILLALLGVYYLWALSSGARAATLPTNLQSILFVGYELLGFMGLGPGRLELRQDGAMALRAYLPYLGIYAAILGVVVWSGLAAIVDHWRIRPLPRRHLLIPVIISLPILFLIIAGLVLTFRVLGRHMTPIFPVAALIIGTGLNALWLRGRSGRLISALFLTLALWSCIEVRTASRHSKDDYKQASVEARTALGAGKRVWWNASQEGALYYGVRVGSDSSNRGVAWLCLNPEPEILKKQPLPDLIIVSRPDVYDNTGGLRGYLTENGYVQSRRMPAFSLWTKSETRER